MKRILLPLILILCFVITSIAQDIIKKKNGDLIKTRIISQDSISLKYKLYSKPSGPTYVVYKKDLEYVQYRSGKLKKYNGSANNVAETTKSISHHTDSLYVPQFNTVGYWKSNKTPGAIAIRKQNDTLRYQYQSIIVNLVPQRDKNQEIIPNKYTSPNCEYFVINDSVIVASIVGTTHSERWERITEKEAERMNMSEKNKVKEEYTFLSKRIFFTWGVGLGGSYWGNNSKQAGSQAISVEARIFENYGLALEGGITSATTEVNAKEYDCYGYYGGLKLAYHLPFKQNWDVYGGISGLYHSVSFTDLSTTSSKNYSGSGFGFDYFIGGRKYFSGKLKHIGLLGEVHFSNTSLFYLGLCVK